ncbi:MAG: DnaJ domain-containing protein [Chrysiogenetes bacterium]|nr:DnaJ domain-containing protein [Chrysiogenetes bacterium]
MSYTPEQLAQIAKAAMMLDQMDYFQVLRVPHDANAADVKSAFFKQSKTWHPDRFYRRVPEDTYRQVMDVYKRISEAYSILRDENLRKLYIKRVTGPNRAQNLRYDKSAEEAKARAKKDEDVAQTEPGKRYVKLAATSINQKNFPSADMNLKLAMSMESENDELKAFYYKFRRDHMKAELTEEQAELLAQFED